MRTSEDYSELFEQVRKQYGGKKFYCHFAGIEHRMGNALHYTQIKKSDLKFEPFAEFLAEEGDWLDITIISDSPLLEHDAMYMLQHFDKAKQRLLEIQARDERRVKLAIEAGMSPEELEMLEKEVAESRKDDGTEEPADKKKKPTSKAAAKKKPTSKAAAKKKSGKMMSFDEKADDDDVF
jgi:deoxyribonuclease-4